MHFDERATMNSISYRTPSINIMALVLVLFGLAYFCEASAATPEDDRKQLLEIYKGRFPDKKVEDYVYGALMFSADAKAQYDSMMEMPPAELGLSKGKSLWEAPFKNGQSLATCFPDGGKGAAGNYPHFDKQLGKVVTFEMAINKCIRDNGGIEFRHDDMSKMGVVSLYARSLSDGMRTNVKVVGPEALAAYEAGKKFFYTRRGQLNFACASCHTGNAGNQVRNEFLSPAVGHTTHWPLFRGEATLGDLFTLQRRYGACSNLVRSTPLPLGSEAYNNLEYFHTYQSNGLPLQAGVWRK